MTSIRMHPSELAYAFSYSKAVDVVGWGRDPFLPSTEADGDPKRWYADGAARMAEAGHLIETPDNGLNFSEPVTEAVLALADPAVVLLAERKAGDGLRRMTVHMAKDTVLGITQNPDGMFELTRYADLTAAAAACAGFLGVARTPPHSDARVETDRDAMNKVRDLVIAGQVEAASSKLVELGVSDDDARSIVSSMAEPVASGVMSVLYCSDNSALHGEPFSVMTNADNQTWILVLPANLDGPMIIERSSVSALAARVTVSVAARLKLAA